MRLLEIPRQRAAENAPHPAPRTRARAARTGAVGTTGLTLSCRLLHGWHRGTRQGSWSQKSRDLASELQGRPPRRTHRSAKRAGSLYELPGRTQANGTTATAWRLHLGHHLSHTDTFAAPTPGLWFVQEASRRSATLEAMVATDRSTGPSDPQHHAVRPTAHHGTHTTRFTHGHQRRQPDGIRTRHAHAACWRGGHRHGAAPADGAGRRVAGAGRAGLVGVPAVGGVAAAGAARRAGLQPGHDPLAASGVCRADRLSGLSGIAALGRRHACRCTTWFWPCWRR